MQAIHVDHVRDARSGDGAGLVAARRIERARRAFATRRALAADMRQLLSDGRAPAAGDLVLARVERLGQHNGLQLPSGRRATLFAGDEIVVAYGNRYAPDQFEATVPPDLGPCDLVAGGGIAARLRHAHRRMRAPTRIQPIGLIADGEGRVLNLQRYRLPRLPCPAPCPPLIAVVGTAMNAGKTTAAAWLIRGLAAAGLRVGAAKLTGTGASGDTHLMMDAGATPVLDFTDAGLATTYLADPEADRRGRDARAGAPVPRWREAIVCEIADAPLQRETAALLEGSEFAVGASAASCSASGDGGAVAGIDHNSADCRRSRSWGALTQSPLAVREAARDRPAGARQRGASRAPSRRSRCSARSARSLDRRPPHRRRGCAFRQRPRRRPEMRLPGIVHGRRRRQLVFLVGSGLAQAGIALLLARELAAAVDATLAAVRSAVAGGTAATGGVGARLALLVPPRSRPAAALARARHRDAACAVVRTACASACCASCCASRRRPASARAAAACCASPAT
ncbi:MAG: hypothetical protein U1F11_10890 [Steroidobacteraceae bacterium]